jgi:hypothetical protein
VSIQFNEPHSITSQNLKCFELFKRFDATTRLLTELYVKYVLGKDKITKEITNEINKKMNETFQT